MRPSYFDLPNAINFYIPVNDNGDALGKVTFENICEHISPIQNVLIIIPGAWYIWPPEGPASFESLSSKQTLVVYMHGNSKGDVGARY